MVYIIAKGVNKYTDQQEYAFKVIYEDVPPPGALSDDGTYNFGYLDIPESETAVGNYDFGCLDEGIDPDTSVINEKDYDFNIFAGDDIVINTGDIFDLKNNKIYYSYYNYETAFRYTGRIYIYDSRIVNNRIRIARIEDAVDSPARAFGWVSINDLMMLDVLPIGEKVIVTGKLYINPTGNGKYIEKEEAVMYIIDFTETVEGSTVDYQYLLANTKTGAGIGYAPRHELEVYDESV